jgi:hypothetical protein
MGLFSSNRSIPKLMNERLGMEWRLLRNVYKNHLINVESNSEDFNLFTKIGSLCDEIDQEIQIGLQSLRKPAPNVDAIVEKMARIVSLDSQISNRPEKSNRTLRLVGITNSVLLGNYQGYFEDANGNHADWYRGL